MNSGLRKAHTYIWLLLVVIIPIVIFFSIKNLALYSSESDAVSQIKDSNKKHLTSFENELIKASVYENSIELILKSTLKNPSSIVYEMNEEGTKSNSIGQMTSAGIYNFTIHKLPKGIIIYDAIKNVEITKFSFKWD